MDIVHPRVTGIDVHKKIIWVAIRSTRLGTRPPDGGVLAAAAEDGGLAGRAGCD